MKVICKYCNGLTEEAGAIKISLADFEFWRGASEGVSVVTSMDNYNFFTQICQDCYFGKKGKVV